MKLAALSRYDNDNDTRFGDCILIKNARVLIIYDCGHEKHAEEIENILKNNIDINEVNIIISHNDNDHTNGVSKIMEYLKNQDYSVKLYTSLYLKDTDKILEILDDERRTPKATREHILEMFDNIRDIVNKANELGFEVINAEVNTNIPSGKIVGPTVDEFASVVAKAIETGNAGTKIDGESVMNAASVQIKITLEGGKQVFLCGDATPEYLHNLENYEIIQLPHHGKLESAKKIFDMLEDPYIKEYLISDNTGSGEKSGGSDALVEFMKEENYTEAYNTKNGVINIPENVTMVRGTRREVKLGGVVN